MDRIKAVLLKDDGDPLWTVMSGGTEPTAAVAERALEAVVEKAGISSGEIDGIVATGAGRKYLSFADRDVPEFQCLAKGIHRLMPSTRILLDLGARKSMAVKCRDGRTLKVASSSKCASGTGTYLEMVSALLSVDFDELTSLALRSEKELSIQSTCAVFAESEIISLVHDGVKPEDIIWGVFRGISGRIYPHLMELGLEEDIVAVGGVARSKAMIAALKNQIGMDIKVPEHSDIVGALGAAIIGREETA